MQDGDEVERPVLRLSGAWRAPAAPGRGLRAGGAEPRSLTAGRRLRGGGGLAAGALAPSRGIVDFRPRGLRGASGASRPPGGAERGVFTAAARRNSGKAFRGYLLFFFFFINVHDIFDYQLRLNSESSSPSFFCSAQRIDHSLLNSSRSFPWKSCTQRVSEARFSSSGFFGVCSIQRI